MASSVEPLVIAVDSSTTSTKALIVDADGTVIASAKRDLPMSTPAMHQYEQDPADWWRTTYDSVGAAIAALDRTDRDRIAAMCVTVQRQSFALLDADDHVVRPAILWLDSRAAAEVERIGTERVHALSGMPPDVTPSLYKLAWLAEHERESLARAARVAGVHAFLAHRLTGEWIDSQATADSLGLFDMARLDYDDSLLGLAGVRREQLPTLVSPGQVISEVVRSVREDWGLDRPLPLIAGCGDGQAAALGCGALGPDEAYLNMGTAIVGGVHSPIYRFGDVYRTDAAGLPGHYVLEIVQNSGAYLAGWFREQLGESALAGRPDPALDAAAAQVPIGSDGLLTLPYWNAVQSPHWDPRARGAVVGFTGSHTRAHLYRSLLEGLCLETARNVHGLEAATGVSLTSIRVMGGGQRSDLWRHMMADCIGLPLTVCDNEEVSAMGAAAMAMSITGAHTPTPDIAASARAMTRLGATTEPDRAAHDSYREISATHSRLYSALTPIFHDPTFAGLR